MVVLRGRLSPEAGAALLRALEAAGQKLYTPTPDEPSADRPSAEQLRADALGLVAESALAGGLDFGTRGDRPRPESAGIAHAPLDRWCATHEPGRAGRRPP